MMYLVSIIHLLTCIFIVIFILLQDPKGGVLGALGGGAASQSFFGAGGASQFLVKTTKWLAIIFACSSFYLSYQSSRQDSDLMSSVVNPATQQKDSKTPTNTKPAQQNKKPAEQKDSKTPANTKPAQQNKKPDTN